MRQKRSGTGLGEVCFCIIGIYQLVRRILGRTCRIKITVERFGYHEDLGTQCVTVGEICKHRRQHLAQQRNQIDTGLRVGLEHNRRDHRALLVAGCGKLPATRPVDARLRCLIGILRVEIGADGIIGIKLVDLLDDRRDSVLRIGVIGVVRDPGEFAKHRIGGQQDPRLERFDAEVFLA